MKKSSLEVQALLELAVKKTSIESINMCYPSSFTSQPQTSFLMSTVLLRYVTFTQSHTGRFFNHQNRVY